MINIGDNLGVQVGGTLVARGTSSQPIIFQSASGITPGSWGSIGFSDTSEDVVMTNGTYSSGSILQHCQIKYGGGGAVGMIVITSATPLLDNCQIQYAATSGIRAENSTDLLIQNCLIFGNSPIAGSSFVTGGGASFHDSTVTLKNNTVLLLDEINLENA